MKTVSLAALALTAVSAAAQTTPGVIGVTSSSPLILSQDPGSCMTTSCRPGLAAGLGPRVLPYEGGTAYDADAGAVWASTGGTTIAFVEDESCSVLCRAATPIAAPWRHITGLALDESMDRLYVSDESNTIYTVERGCPGRVVRSCLAPVPARHIIGGLATDDVRRRIFYSSSDWLSGGPPSNMIHVATLGAICSPFCSFAVPTSCGTLPLGPITGLGYDACTHHLWLTDGVVLMGLALPSVGTPCRPTITHCCRLPSSVGSDEFCGLAFEPSHAESVGSSCTGGVCAPCPSIVHSVSGDAYLAGSSFSLLVEGVPVGSSPFVMLGFGVCTSGLPVPVFCGALYVPLASSPITFGPLPTFGSIGACSGRASFALPIPRDPGLCGFPLCSQWLGLCGAPGAGTWMSNAQSFVITSP